MKLIMFMAYPVLVIALWVTFAAFTLSSLRTVGASLRTIDAAEQPVLRPSDATGPDRSPGVAHGGGIEQGSSNSG